MFAPIKVGLPGFGGRMGQMIARLIQEDSSFDLVAATETLNSKLIGRDISHNLGTPKTGIKISASADILGNNSDVIIIGSLGITILMLGAVGVHIKMKNLNLH